MIGKVGLKPEEFWSNTVRHNHLLAKYKNNEEEESWKQTRNIEFAAYNTAFGGMTGKPIFPSIKKPQDLYRLPSDELIKIRNKAVYNPDRAIAAFNRTEKDESKWLTKI